MIAVVAMNADGCIGRRGVLPWHHPEDLAFFKRTTLGGTIVMGRRTWDGLPRRPLPGRRNVVLTQRPIASSTPEVVFADRSGLDAVLTQSPTPIFVIGGAAIYALLWDHLDEVLVTRVPDAVFDCDTWFPRDLADGFDLVAKTSLSASCVAETWRRRTARPTQVGPGPVDRR